ncbi:hypothetical protein ACROYT_G008285 [Oculina patagonica]
MNIPAYAAPTLCIGRTYDARNTAAGIDIFPSEITTKEININQFTFKYKVVRNSSDVKDLLDISGELSLKVKAGLVKVEGSGKYLSDTNTKEGTTELLAVLKCVTINETMEGSVKVRDEVASGQQTYGIGTHFVRGITYGAEMVASLSIKESSSAEKVDIQGKAEGEITAQAADIGLRAELKKLTSTCKDTADISIKYYATDLPDKLPTTLNDLVKLIEEFPSRLKNINDGKGIPLQFELLPINAAPGIQTAGLPSQHELPPATAEWLEQCFDDLRSAQSLLQTYEESSGDTDDDDVLEFSQQLNKVMRKFRDAISVMNSSEGKQQVDTCLEAYQKALDERDISGKFCKKWKGIFETKAPVSSIKLHKGEDLTIVLLGKSGNGKSKTGNRIIGRDTFKASTAAKSVTRVCSHGTRKDERHIDVIDTPGVVDTAPLKPVVEYIRANNAGGTYILGQNDTSLHEVARMFAMAPDGFHAFIFVVKYGRFTLEDGQELSILQQFLGKEVNENMILLLTHGDQAEDDADENGETVEQTLEKWLKTLPTWVQKFINEEINGRTVLFNNKLGPDKEPEEYKKQLSRLITVSPQITNQVYSRFFSPTLSVECDHPGESSAHEILLLLRTR